MDIVALRPFKGEEGWVQTGRVLRGVEETRAKALIRSGLAAEKDDAKSPPEPAEKARRTPANKQAPAPQNKVAGEAGHA